MKMTAKRRAWLKHLRDHGPAVSHSNVGFHCRKAGLTEWYVKLKDGRQLPIHEFYAEFSAADRHLAWEQIVSPLDTECITTAGLTALGDAP